MTSERSNGDAPGRGSDGADAEQEAWSRFDDAADVTSGEWVAMARRRAARLGFRRGSQAESATQEVREAHHSRVQGIATMSERIARATGASVSIENTGGDVMVGTLIRRDGAVVAFTAEGVALYASRSGWDEGAEPIRAESASPWAVVASAVAWTVGEGDVK